MQGSTTFRIGKLDPWYSGNSRKMAVMLAPNLTLLAGTVLGQITANAVNEVQSVTINATGGTYTLTYAGQTTAPIAWNATAAQVAAALALLPNIGLGQVSGAGGPGGTAAINVTFQGLMAGLPVNLMTSTPAGLTGGAGTAAIAEVTHGVAGQRFAAYAAGNGDGTQLPKCLLAWDITTDDRGNAIVGSAQTQPEQIGGIGMSTMEAFYRGTFRVGDLVGFDATAAAALGRFLKGTIASADAVFELF